MGQFTEYDSKNMEIQTITLPTWSDLVRGGACTTDVGGNRTIEWGMSIWLNPSHWPKDMWCWDEEAFNTWFACKTCGDLEKMVLSQKYAWMANSLSDRGYSMMTKPRHRGKKSRDPVGPKTNDEERGREPVRPKPKTTDEEKAGRRKRALAKTVTKRMSSNRARKSRVGM